jgi:hypothetical protein
LREEIQVTREQYQEWTHRSCEMGRVIKGAGRREKKEEIDHGTLPEQLILS